MKTRIFAALVVCAVAGLAGWYYLNPPASEAANKTAKTADAKASPATTPAFIAKPNTIETPKRTAVAPVAPPVVTAAPAANAAASPKAEESIIEAKADLKECITQTLTLLEAKDVAALLKTLMPPTVVQQMIDSGRATSFEDIVAQYSQRPDINQKMAELQQALESVKDQSPEMSPDGQQATFKLAPFATGPDGPTSKGNITFVQIEGNWYLR